MTVLNGNRTYEDDARAYIIIMDSNISNICINMYIIIHVQESFLMEVHL